MVLVHLAARLRAFARAREWEPFHTPKNLAMALAGEAGELAAIFQWATPEQSWDMTEPTRRTQLEDGLADVLIHLVRLADLCDIDLVEAECAKIDRNERGYPVELLRGNAEKHSARAGWDGDDGLEDA